MTMTAVTASAGQAVYFIAQATPTMTAASRRPRRAARASPLPGRRASSASARQVKAITGGAGMPLVRGDAMIGQDSANAAQPSAAPTGALITPNGAERTRNVAAMRAGRVPPGTPSAPGRPNTAITGRYGL